MRLILAWACGGSGVPCAVRRAQRFEALAPVPQQRVVFIHAQRRQHGANAVHQSHPLGHEFRSLPDAAPGILVGLVGDRHHRAHARLAAQPSQQRAQEQLRVNPVGFGPPCPAIDRNTRRLHDVRLDAVCRQPARQPKAGPARLVGGDHPLNLPPSRMGPFPVALDGGQQCLGRGLDGPLGLDARQAGHLGCKHPARIAQLDREHERAVVVGYGRNRL